MSGRDNPKLGPLMQRVARALGPIAVFAGVALALVLVGELANEFRTGGSRARWYDFAWLFVLFAYLASSVVMLVMRLQQREFLRAASWAFIGAITISRILYPEIYRSAEDRMIPYALAKLAVCDIPQKAHSSSAFTVCYAYQRFPWDRILIRSASNELLLPVEHWSEGLKASLESNRLTQNIVYCGYRRITQISPDYLFVEVACG